VGGERREIPTTETAHRNNALTFNSRPMSGQVKFRQFCVCIFNAADQFFSVVDFQCGEDVAIFYVAETAEDLRKQIAIV
jgi:hypothetical protein